ncbi:predicted protein [Chaetomium globosum CBS 148.51]|uniref:Uncharacterized protein n=1 Tax=Chaetomium globosum (strain ATCC 6205 / CBS 148.51 / DSM 1962 / NBRC 6347 / NRRL 1970) TaxID=306901 RepID=Q2HI97_CHAGB|nr:uncharacterized protein CHGG_00057 [Chaetomium globosum CBS 148.51]EAQ91822.1 predicted protein [Chaetomium globosum CBS 148.51]
MKSLSNHGQPSSGASSTVGPISGPALSHASIFNASTSGSNNPTTSSQTDEQPYQLLAYLAQPADEEGSVYGRLGGCIAVVHTNYAGLELEHQRR